MTDRPWPTRPATKDAPSAALEDAEGRALVAAIHARKLTEEDTK